MTNITLATSQAKVHKSIFGHPAGLFTLFLVEAWERFTFYGMRALLILFMTATISTGGLGLAPETAGAIYGLYMAGVYLLSLPGGWLADRVIGPRKAVFWGALLIILGNLIISIPGQISLFFSGLLVITLGVGLLKPNVSVMVGSLYQNDPPARRDAGFSIFYFGIYLGAFIAPLIAGTLGETLGYRWGFFSAAIAMVLGLITYRMTSHWLGDVGLHVHKLAHKERRASWFVLLGLLVLAAFMFTSDTIASISVFQWANALGTLMIALTVFFFGYVLLLGGLSNTERKRISVILILCLCAALFLAGLEQAGSTMNLFARDFTDRSFLGDYFSTGAHPASWYQSISPSFILILSPFFAWMWISLGRKSRDPSAPVKFGLSLILLGSSFAVMILAVKFTISTGLKASPAWLVSVYFLQTVGELCLSPIGLSNVSRLSPGKFAGQMMGMWFLAAAMGSLVAGMIGGSISSAPLSDMPHQFLKMAIVGIGAGIVMLLLARPIIKWMAFDKP